MRTDKEFHFQGVGKSFPEKIFLCFSLMKSTKNQGLESPAKILIENLKSSQLGFASDNENFYGFLLKFLYASLSYAVRLVQNP